MTYRFSGGHATSSAARAVVLNHANRALLPSVHYTSISALAGATTLTFRDGVIVVATVSTFAWTTVVDLVVGGSCIVETAESTAYGSEVNYPLAICTSTPFEVLTDAGPLSPSLRACLLDFHEVPLAADRSLPSLSLRRVSESGLTWFVSPSNALVQAGPLTTLGALSAGNFVLIETAAAQPWVPALLQ